MEHTEEDDHHTEEAVLEAPLAKPRKKMTYTPEQLERKRESMKKAREFRNISYKEENKPNKELNVSSLRRKLFSQGEPSPSKESIGK